MARPVKTQEEIEATRERILDAAHSILESAGPAAISTRAVAKHLGMAHMTLYRYFENKDAILAALRTRELSKWRLRQQGIEERAASEPAGKLVMEMLRSIGEFAHRAPNVYHLAWAMPEALGESLEQTRERTRGTVGQFARLLKISMERGEIEKREPILAAATSLAIVNVPHMLYHAGKLSDPKMRRQMEEEVVRAAMLWLVGEKGSKHAKSL